MPCPLSCLAVLCPHAGPARPPWRPLHRWTTAHMNLLSLSAADKSWWECWGRSHMCRGSHASGAQFAAHIHVLQTVIEKMWLHAAFWCSLWLENISSESHVTGGKINKFNKIKTGTLSAAVLMLWLCSLQVSMLACPPQPTPFFGGGKGVGAQTLPGPPVQKNNRGEPQSAACGGKVQLPY